MTNQSQLELGLGNAQAFQLRARQAGRVNRAQWWFEQMRQVVDQALDWHPSPPARPQQAWLTLAKRAQRAS